MKNIHKINQHIYITSDEEIKDGDWILYCNSVYKALRINSNNRPVVKMSDGEFELSYFEKIILTTDPDLIKDGVQPIDDEFLEWFVKNPSCEEVETKLVEFEVDMGLGESCVEYGSYYEIIIPKEEPKQIKCYCGHTTTCDCSPIDEPKQETLEEVAERIAMTKDWDFESSEGNGYYDYVEGFTEGAKWQQERMYSEEDLREAFKSGRMVENYKGEWEETYSDEMTSCKYEDFNKWFEQFKKK